MGHRQQGNRRRQEERVGTRQENEPQLLPERREERRTRLRLALEILPLRCGTESRLDSAAPVVREPEEHQSCALQQQSQPFRRHQPASVHFQPQALGRTKAQPLISNAGPR